MKINVIMEISNHAHIVMVACAFLCVIYRKGKYIIYKINEGTALFFKILVSLA